MKTTRSSEPTLETDNKKVVTYASLNQINTIEKQQDIYSSSLSFSSPKTSNESFFSPHLSKTSITTSSNNNELNSSSTSNSNLKSKSKSNTNTNSETRLVTKTLPPPQNRSSGSILASSLLSHSLPEKNSFYSSVSLSNELKLVINEKEFKVVPQYSGILHQPGDKSLQELPENISRAITRVQSMSKTDITKPDKEVEKALEILKQAEPLNSTKSLEPPKSTRFQLPFFTGKIFAKINAYLTHLMQTPTAKEWKYWDICLRCVDIYYIIIIPTMIAFSCEQYTHFLLHFIVFDLFYILRVIFSLIRPVYNQYGELITDLKGIRNYYFPTIHSKLELLGAIPFDWIVVFLSLVKGTYSEDFTCRNPWYCYSNDTFSKTPYLDSTLSYSLRYDYYISDIPTPLLVFSLLRINKLFSTFSTLHWLYFLKLEKYINGPILKIIKNLLAWQLFSHIDACIFWLMETCADPSHRFIKRRYIVEDQDGHPTFFSHRFIANLHTAQKSLFFVQREVEEFEEYLFQTLETLFAAVIFGSTLGNLNSIMRLFNSEAALDKASKDRNFKMKYLSQYMIDHKFPVSLQKKILLQEAFEWFHKKGMDTNRLFTELPKTIRLEVSVHLYYDLISKVPIFKNVEEIFKVALCERISTITIPKGFYICKAGDPGTEMYFLKSGTVEILNKDETICLATLKLGSFFGEIALFEECRRTATIKTIEDSQLCVLRKADFNDILREYPELVEVFRTAVLERQAKDQRRKQEEEQRKKEQAEKDLAAAANRHDQNSKLLSMGNRSSLVTNASESTSIRASPQLNSAIPIVMTRRLGEGLRKAFTRSAVTRGDQAGWNSGFLGRPTSHQN